MTYWDEKEYWADASTRNCVWLFQIKRIIYPKAGCICGAEYNDEGEEVNKDCECANEVWYTECVFLTRKEATAWGERRPYEWGEQNKGWRIYGVPCYGLMAELLGKNTNAFKTEVARICDTDKDEES
jgi:hypothetical protein